MGQRRRIYVTTPIYYVNDLPHIGHTYTTVVADAIARFHRLSGDDVRFLTGTDEHGQKMQRAAEARGMTPAALADEVVRNYEVVWPALGISYDDFIRTTEPRHKKGVYALFSKIRERDPDVIYRGTYRGLYCTGCESFFTETQVTAGRCPDEGHPVEEVTEDSWFFRLSAFGDRLLNLYEAQPDFVMPPSRLNEVRGFVGSGLKDLSISRSREKVGWGIPFPGDDEQTIYVWFDALTNYISALGYGDGPIRPLYDRYWGAGGSEGAERLQLHLIGKDILRFHAVFWPAFLMAAGEPLPRRVFAHGWWLRDAAKMSKTRGNVVRPAALLDDYGADAVRWFLLREISLGQDGVFSDEALIGRTNSDLANNIGNLFSRVVTLVARNEDGVCPDVAPVVDAELDAAGETARRIYRDAFESHDPGAALRAVTDWSDALNRFLVRKEPWRRKGREAECAAILRTACGVLAHIALRLEPAMPSAGARLLSMLGFEPEQMDSASCRDENRFDVAEWPVGGRNVRAGEVVFPRLDKAQILGTTDSRAKDSKGSNKRRNKKEEGQMTDSGGTAAAAAKGKPEGASDDAATKTEPIGIDAFRSVELKTGTIVVAEKHPNADRLLRLEVDLGSERRQIVAGIAAAYAPEDLVGRTVVVVANLTPVRLRGIVSEGMVLAATGSDGVVRLVSVDGTIEPGSGVS